MYPAQGPFDLGINAAEVGLNSLTCSKKGRLTSTGKKSCKTLI